MSLTDDQREQHVCCVKRRLCTEDHYHERDVVKMLADAWREGHRAALDGVFPLRPEDNPYRGQL